MTKTIILSLPDDVDAATEQAASANGETLDAYFTRLAGFDAERQATASFFAARRNRADNEAARDLLTGPRGESPGK